MVPFIVRDLNQFDNGLMVPLSERRHRLYRHEIPEVVTALKLYLEKQAEKKANAEEAETAFRILYRLTNEKPGRPIYPEFSWEYLGYYLDFQGNEKLCTA